MSDDPKERRKAKRVRCRLSCELQRGSEREDGTVLDMSQGGLSVRSPLKGAQGEPLIVRIQAPSGPVEVEALVWHTRLVRTRGSKETFWVLGLMLSKAPDTYLHLVPRPQPKTADSEEEGAAEPPDESDGLHSFRIRVKHRSGPRTRVLSLNAKSEDEARSLAIENLEDEWEILEVAAA